MNKKKVTTMLLAMAVVIGSFAGCAGKKVDTASSDKSETTDASGRKMKGNVYVDGKLPLVKDSTTIKIATVADTDPSTKVMLKELEEKTNVKVEWIFNSLATWPEKKSIMFASKSLPDAFMGGAPSILTDQEVMNYGSQGLLIPLDQYLTPTYMPNIVDDVINEHPELKKAITMPDGKIYSLPSYDYGITTTTNAPMFINKTWLDNLGLQMPKTTDELYNVLKAFKEKDPNKNGKKDEIPFTFTGNISDFFGAFGVIDNYSSHIGIKDGKVVYTAVQPGYKDAIKYFNKLYAEELIDSESFTQNGTVFSAKWQKGNDGKEDRIVGLFQIWRPNRDKDYVALEPLKGPSGNQLWVKKDIGLQEKGDFVITSDCKTPELVAEWADQLYEPDFAVQMSFSYKIGVHMSKEADGKFKLIKAPDLSKEEDKQYFMGNGNRIVVNMSESNGKRIFIPPHMIEKQEYDKLYEKYYPSDPNYPKVNFTLEEMKDLAQLQTDINTYANEQYTKWIMKGGIDADWDGYLKKLKDMGLDKYIKIHEDALDRYNKVK